MEVFIALLAISLTLVFVYLKYLLSYWKRRDIPHLEPSFPEGNIKGLRKTKQLKDILSPTYEKFKGTGPFAGFYFMAKPTVVALDLDFVKNVLIKDFNNFDDRGMFNNDRDDTLSGNLLQLNGHQWRPLRRKLSPTFTSGKMKIMYPAVQQLSLEFMDVLTEMVKANSTVEMVDKFSRFTADVIGTCAFGLECNSLRNPEADFVTYGKRFLLETKHSRLINNFIISFPKLAAKLRMVQTLPASTDFYTKIVKETVEYREKNKIKRNDFMNMLIEMKNNSDINENERLTFNEIVAQVFIFFLGGFETSSTTLGYTVYELAKNQSIQDKLRAEVKEVFKRHNNELTYEGMEELKYLQQVTSETLRKYPIAAWLQRVANGRYESSDPKYYIEKDTLVLIPVYSIQHDPDVYPNPEVFDPDRFTEEGIKSRHSCSWLPFGDGPRNCIGMRFAKMQMTIGLAHLIKNFKLSVCDETPKQIQFVKENLALSPQGGIHIKLEKI